MLLPYKQNFMVPPAMPENRQSREYCEVRPVEVMGVKMGLREYLEDMELKDPGAFMEQLKDFSQKCLGSSRWQVGARHRRY